MTNFWSRRNLVLTGSSSIESGYQYLPGSNPRYSRSKKSYYQRLPKYVVPNCRALTEYDGQNGLCMEVVIRIPPTYETQSVKAVPLKIHMNVPKWQNLGSRSFVVKVRIPGSSPKYIRYPSSKLRRLISSGSKENMCAGDVSRPLFSVDTSGNLDSYSHFSLVRQPDITTRNVVVNLSSRMISQDDEAQLSLPELSLSSSLSSDPSTSPPTSTLEAKMLNLDVSYSRLRNSEEVKSKVDQTQLTKQVKFSEIVEHINISEDMEIEMKPQSTATL